MVTIAWPSRKRGENPRKADHLGPIRRQNGHFLHEMARSVGSQAPAGSGGASETTGPIDLNFSNRRRTSVSDWMRERSDS